MKKLRTFSMARFGAMLAKEFVQMRRDRLTFAMMIGTPGGRGCDQSGNGLAAQLDRYRRR